MALRYTARRIARNSPLSVRASFLSLTPAFLCKFLCFLSLVSLGGVAVAAAPHSSSDSKTPGPSFAIADFDGDLHPDLASVEVASSNRRHTIYSIQLQLTAAGRQVIRVVAPSGGLQILARDVNGDHAIDLVVATAIFGEPVAVLLNDGHGAFTQVDQSGFPGTFGGSATDLTTNNDPLVGAADAPPSPLPGISLLSNPSPHPVPKTFYAAPCSPSFLRALFLSSRPSRAPPSRIALL